MPGSFEVQPFIRLLQTNFLFPVHCPHPFLAYHNNIIVHYVVQSWWCLQFTTSVHRIPNTVYTTVHSTVTFAEAYKWKQTILGSNATEIRKLNRIVRCRAALIVKPSIGKWCHDSWKVISYRHVLLTRTLKWWKLDWCRPPFEVWTLE